MKIKDTIHISTYTRSIDVRHRRTRARTESSYKEKLKFDNRSLLGAEVRCEAYRNKKV